MIVRVIKKAVRAMLPILPYGLVMHWNKVRWNHTLHYFQKNQKRVDAVAALLADERSREVYRGIINARIVLGVVGGGGDSVRECFKYYTPQAQYFENEFFKYGDDEFLIDCGAFTGDTIDSFIKFVPNYKGIISFEATPASFEALKKKHGNDPKIQLINKGIWSEITKLTFRMPSGTNPDYTGAGNRIVEDTGSDTVNIDVTSIDALDIQEKVTIIKMDIEGAELEALKGAVKTILRDKPRLAISIYHSNEHMIEIAEFIHDLVPEYKLYVRHHFVNLWETVLYGCV